jgi:hypothetical protein
VRTTANFSFHAIKISQKCLRKLVLNLKKKCFRYSLFEPYVLAASIKYVIGCVSNVAMYLEHVYVWPRKINKKLTHSNSMF